jgi:hypothetical protein
MIHAASLETSARLQRVYSLLRKGAEFTTRQIQQGADVCAVNTAIDELRDPINGIPVKCTRRGKYWYYQIQQEKTA